MNTDPDLHFGVLALRLHLIDARQFADACDALSAGAATSLADLLLHRGWIAPADRAAIEHVLAMSKTRLGGRAAGLAGVAEDKAWRGLAALDDSDPASGL